MPPISRKLLAKGSVLLIGTLATFAVINEEFSASTLYQTFRGGASSSDAVIYVPSSLTIDSQRALLSDLSVDSQRALKTNDLGGGNCKWGPPNYDVPPKEEVQFHKTLIAGYPSGDKRMIFVQMEALTGWPAKDEWDFEFEGDSNHPFIKANYPHHEGVWGWGDNADQMVLMVRNIRRSMVEYYDIRWDLGFAETYDEVASLDLDVLYGERAPLEDFFLWRDEKVMDEIYWYGWEIDYWMEGGLMRDMFSHGITSPEHFAMEMDPRTNTRADLEGYYLTNVAPRIADGSIVESYDVHCDPSNPQITSGCEPVAVISAEKLRDPARGPQETEAIANVLLNDDRMGQFMISNSAWRCVWRELIVNKKGLKTVYDRPGNQESDYNFSEEMLTAMIVELNRLIEKYGEVGSVWENKDTAIELVSLLTEHVGEIQDELDGYGNGNRKTLRDKDFLGPKERKRRRDLYLSNAADDLAKIRKDYTAYFNALAKKRWEDQQDARRLASEKKMSARK
mmetsp:Transcript_379/g.816  ORF Transcript_379/g.816 Transcript_379/m.816 type:complete len:508 (-) Transcript_379:146-1669(-)